MRMKLKTAAAAVAIALGLSALAPSAPVQAQEQLTKLRVGYIPVGIYAYLWRARDAGYFKDEKIEVELVVMAGGGVASSYDPLDVTQYTLDEMRAAVECAENFGTYVMVHAYTPRAIRQALEAGVRSIEHGQLLDEETVELIAKKDAWWSLQPFLDDDDMVPEPNPVNQRKALDVAAGTDRAYAMAKKLGIKVAWGTDTLFSPDLATRQGEQLAKMVRWYTPAEVLSMGTFQNAQLLAMSGPRNPYPGTLGVVEDGAMADLVLIQGNPLDDITLIQQSETAMVVIMKDGDVVKNTLPATA